MTAVVLLNSLNDHFTVVTVAEMNTDIKTHFCSMKKSCLYLKHNVTYKRITINDLQQGGTKPEYIYIYISLFIIIINMIINLYLFYTHPFFFHFPPQKKVWPKSRKKWFSPKVSQDIFSVQSSLLYFCTGTTI